MTEKKKPEPRGWYRVTLVKTPGPRRRLLDLGKAGRLKFNLDQDDTEALDFPSKRVSLPASVAKKVDQAACWSVEATTAPQGTRLGSKLAKRKKTATPSKPPAKEKADG